MPSVPTCEPVVTGGDPGLGLAPKTVVKQQVTRTVTVKFSFAM